MQNNPSKNTSVGMRSTSDYSGFGVQLDGRTSDSEGYRYGFQGQERDDEVKGDGNSVNYTFRMHDPRVGRFFAVDPLAPNYPWYTPYSFSGNKVIAFRELEGLEEISIHNYSFAPFYSFGGGYLGDDKADAYGKVTERQFGDEINYIKGSENFRIGCKVTMDLTNSAMIDSKSAAYGAESHHYPTGVTAFSEAQFDKRKFNKETGELNIGIEGNNDAFLWGMTPDIDVNIDIKFKDVSKPGGKYIKWRISGEVYGDRFPSNKTFMVDNTGAKLFIGVSGIDASNATTAPFTELLNFGSENMQKFNFNVLFNQDGSFRGVSLNDGQWFKVEDWNKKFTDLAPRGLETGTNVTDNNVETNYTNDTSDE
jgi:RHS repeat-associated protein